MRFRVFKGLVLPAQDVPFLAMKRSFGIAFLFLTCSCCALASPCGSSGTTLQDYINAGTCTDLAGVMLSDFSFSVIAPDGTTVPIRAANISVLLFPNLTSGGTLPEGLSAGNGIGVTDGVEFVFNNQAASGVGLVDYQIGFTFDDPSGDLRDILDPGPVNITTGLCVGSAFVNGACSTGATSESVSEGAPISNLFGSVSSTTWGIQNNIILNAAFDTTNFGIENDVVTLSETLEPADARLVLCGLAAILLYGLRISRNRKVG